MKKLFLSLIFIASIGNLLFSQVIIYEHEMFKGKSQTLSAGKYDMNKITIGNDVLSSIKVPKGYKVRLYEHANFEGKYKDYKNDMTFVGWDFNEKTSSIVVTQIGKTNNTAVVHTNVETGLNIGQVAPEIVQMGKNGQNIKLSELRGKVVLIDFWASWCSPCRYENRNLIKTYAHFKNKNFTVFSVSLDQNKSAWLQAIKADKLDWKYHVSDLKGWSNAAGKKYSVNSIPSNFLIDEKGVIIGKGLRGEALDKALEKYLGKAEPSNENVTEGFEIGNLAPNIIQTGKDGQNLNLSNLRGKVVLIDFWASWCSPCRYENRNLIKTYAHFKNKNFTVFSVSLDQNKSAWLQAIKADKLDWEYHVSDLKGWSNAAGKKYSVNSIPSNFLIDERGVIIGKDLRGNALDKALEKYFK